MVLETTVKIRKDSEEEAKDTIETYRKEAAQKHYILKKASYEYKTKKAKGEIIAEAWVVTVTLFYAGLWEDFE